MKRKSTMLKLCGLVLIGLLIYWVGVAIYTGGLDVLSVPIRLLEKEGGVMIYSGEATAQVGTDVIRYEVYSGGAGFSEGFSTCDLVLLRKGSKNGGCSLLLKRLIVDEDMIVYPNILECFKLLPLRLLPVVKYGGVAFVSGKMQRNASIHISESNGNRVYQCTYSDFPDEFGGKRNRQEFTLTVPLSCWRN